MQSATVVKNNQIFVIIHYIKYAKYTTLMATDHVNYVHKKSFQIIFEILCFDRETIKR